MFQKEMKLKEVIYNRTINYNSVLLKELVVAKNMLKATQRSSEFKEIELPDAKDVNIYKYRPASSFNEAPNLSKSVTFGEKVPDRKRNNTSLEVSLKIPQLKMERVEYQGRNYPSPRFNYSSLGRHKDERPLKGCLKDSVKRSVRGPLDSLRSSLKTSFRDQNMWKYVGNSSKTSI